MSLKPAPEGLHSPASRVYAAWRQPRVRCAGLLYGKVCHRSGGLEV